MNTVTNPLTLTTCRITDTEVVISCDEVSTTFANISAVTLHTWHSITLKICQLRILCKEKGIKLRISQKKLKEIEELHEEYVDDVISYNSAFRSAKEDWKRIVKRGFSPLCGNDMLQDVANAKMNAVAPLAYASQPISRINSYVHLIDEHLRHANMEQTEDSYKKFYI